MTELTDIYKEQMTKAIEEMGLDINWEQEYETWRSSRNKYFLGRIVTKHLPMCFYFIKQNRVPQQYVDDCLQAGNLAIIQAMESWNPDKEYSISSWIYMYVKRDIQREYDRVRNDPEIENIDEIAETMDKEPDEEDGGHMPQATDYASLTYECQGMSEAGKAWLYREIQKEDWPTKNLFELVLRSGHSVREAGWILGMSQSKADRLFQKVICRLRVTSGS